MTNRVRSELFCGRGLRVSGRGMALMQLTSLVLYPRSSKLLMSCGQRLLKKMSVE